MKEKMKWTVSWRWNNKDYFESYPTLLQAMVRKWRLDEIGKDASIHLKD